eukprot:8943-Rhodomonas_salina.1
MRRGIGSRRVGGRVGLVVVLAAVQLRVGRIPGGERRRGRGGRGGLVAALVGAAPTGAVLELQYKRALRMGTAAASGTSESVQL